MVNEARIEDLNTLLFTFPLQKFKLDLCPDKLHHFRQPRGVPKLRKVRWCVFGAI